MSEEHKVAWLGPKSKFSEKLKAEVSKHFDEVKVSWNYFSIESENIGKFFLNHRENKFDWILVDFSEKISYKIDLTKIMGKYSMFKSSLIVGMMNKKEDVLLNTDFLGLPLNALALHKKDIKDIIEDIEILSGQGQVNDEHFKTLGFENTLWVQIPCRANYKDRTIKLYPQTEDFSPISGMKNELRNMKLDPDSMEHIWANQPDDFMSITIYENDKELFFQGNEFRKDSDKFRIKLPEKEVIEFGNSILSHRVSNDKRKRVLIFDPQMEFFTKCWGTKQAESEVNMFNFPYFTSDFRIVDALEPEMIIVRGSIKENDGGVDEVGLLELMNKVSKLEENKPHVVIFNCPDLSSIDYQKLLKVPFDMDGKFIDKLLKLVVKGESFNIDDKQIEIDRTISEWRNARLTSLVFLNVPVIIKEISENCVKIKCPFKIDKSIIVYEKFLFGVFLALTPHLEANDKDAIYSGVFIGENESQKSEIRKFVNELNFTPKTEEQRKDLQDFHDINRLKLEEIEKAKLEGTSEEESEKESDESTDSEPKAKK